MSKNQYAPFYRIRDKVAALCSAGDIESAADEFERYSFVGQSEEYILHDTCEFIEKVADYDEFISEANEVEKHLKELAKVLKKAIKKLHSDIALDIKCSASGNGGALEIIEVNLALAQNKKLRNFRLEVVDDVLKEFRDWQRSLDSVIKRRHEEYWKAHQSDKNQLLSKKEILSSEKQKLLSDIADLEHEFNEFQRKSMSVAEDTDEYRKLHQVKQECDDLRSEKKALGLFKFKEKKAVKIKIKEVQIKIATAEEDYKKPYCEAQQLISLEKARIDNLLSTPKNEVDKIDEQISEIDHELTKPR
jgi:hypothetical protein